MESFTTSLLKGNEAQCPHCNQITGCNKENIRINGTNEGFVGIDT
jgi:hypothetical protein